MQKKPDNSIKNFIMLIICSIVIPPLVFLFYNKDVPFVFAPLLSIILAAFFTYSFIRERKADIAAESKIDELISDSHFNTPEWREKYLRYTMEHPFVSPQKSSLREDISDKYRKTFSFLFAGFGVFMIVGSISMFFMDTVYILVIPIGGIFLGLFILGMEICKLAAVPLKKFYEENSGNIEAIESSYKGGRMLIHKNYGINIGREYTVIYTNKLVTAIKNSEITDVFRHITRVKEYQNNTYAGEEYIHSVCIVTTMPYLLELNEFQVEMVINELRSFGGVRIENTYDESYHNEDVI